MTTTELCTRNSAEQHATTWVRIRITDTRVGMPADVVARAFEPCFTTKPRGAGTGLGLASAYGIVTQNGGEIAIDSQPGRGTTIELMFPCHDAPTGPSHHAPTAVSPARHERILLVEDEDSLRRATERIIASFGYHVIAVSDGDEALAILDGAGPPIDLVITDIVMKRVSGSDLAKEIANRNPEYHSSSCPATSPRTPSPQELPCSANQPDQTHSTTPSEPPSTIHQPTRGTPGLPGGSVRHDPNCQGSPSVGHGPVGRITTML